MVYEYTVANLEGTPHRPFSHCGDHSPVGDKADYSELLRLRTSFRAHLEGPKRQSMPDERGGDFASKGSRLMGFRNARHVWTGYQPEFRFCNLDVLCLSPVETTARPLRNRHDQAACLLRNLLARRSKDHEITLQSLPCGMRHKTAP
ncbi:MAG TPA: hypothetical protein VG898_03500 [Solirubrobacterales bacterium]|nr:hypothetical protein [Solirubrobacterales bacterium]